MTTPPMDLNSLPLSDDPKQRAGQMALIKLLTTPPEQLLQLFERLQIPWERLTIDGEPCFVVKWADLMAGEARNQEQGPYMRKLMEEMQNQLATPPEIFRPEPKVERPAPKKRTQPKKGTAKNG
jgi:hypothetical protein